MPEPTPDLSEPVESPGSTVGSGDAGLLRPVAPTSVMRHHPRIRYTELAGVGVLCNLETRAVSTLSPGAAAAWARFDGRTALADIGPGRDLVELARRLRALGALVDVPAYESGPPPADPSAAERGPARVVLHGGWTARTSHAVVELHDPREAGPTVAVERGPDGFTVSSLPVLTIVAPDPGGAVGPLAPVAALELLVAGTERSHLARPGCLDLLAEIVDRVEVVGPLPVSG